MTALRSLSRGWLDGNLNPLSLQTRGWLGPTQAFAGAGASSAPTRRLSMGGAMWMPPRMPIPRQDVLVPVDIDEVGLRISVQAGVEMSKADLYDMIALSIAEELEALKRTE